MGAFTSAFSTALNVSTAVLGVFAGEGAGTGTIVANILVPSTFTGQGEGTGTITAVVATFGAFTSQGEGAGTATGSNIVLASATGAGEGTGTANAFLVTTGAFNAQGEGSGAATSYLLVPSAFIGTGEGSGTAILTQLWTGSFTAQGESLGTALPINITYGTAIGSGEGDGLVTSTLLTISARAIGTGEGQGTFTGKYIRKIPEFVSLIPPDLAQYWGNYLERNMPRFNSRKIFGTYGTIELRVQWEYPYALPNYLYQSINNAEEASWWLNYYKNRPDIDGVIFYPAPDQHSTGTFTLPNLPAYVGAPPEDDWMKKVLIASSYQFGSSGNTF